MSDFLKYGLVIITCLAFSVGGIWVASKTIPDDGGDGGAIGVVISLFTLFIRNNLGGRAYEFITRKLDRNSLEPAILKDRLTAIEGRMMMDGRAQFRQNIAILVATFVSTLFWAIGADIAKELAKGLKHGP